VIWWGGIFVHHLYANALARHTLLFNTFFFGWAGVLYVVHRFPVIQLSALGTLSSLAAIL
jgi:hypothetical protein